MTYAEYLIESAQSEHTLFEELLASDYKELALIKEGADEFQIMLLHEGTVEKIWNAIKTAWKKFCDLVSGLFKKVIEKCKKLKADCERLLKKMKKQDKADESSDKKSKFTIIKDDSFNDFNKLAYNIYSDKGNIFDVLLNAKIGNDEYWLKKYGIDCTLDEVNGYFKDKFVQVKEVEIDKNDPIDRYNITQYIVQAMSTLMLGATRNAEHFNEFAKEVEEDIDKFKVSSDKYSSDQVAHISASFNTYRKVLSKVSSCIVSTTSEIMAICEKTKNIIESWYKEDKEKEEKKEESQILYNIKSRSLNESDVDDDDEDDGDYDEVDDKDIYYIADEFGDDDDIYYDAEDDEDEVDDYDLDDLEEGCCGKKSAKKECGDASSTVEPIIGSDESCCGKKEACCKKENNVELDSPDIALAPEDECGASCVKKECTSVKSEVIANGPKADTVEAKANVTDNPNGATYDQTNSYSDDEAKADGLGLDGSIDTTLEDPFDSKETDLFSGVNFSELFW